MADQVATNVARNAPVAGTFDAGTPQPLFDATALATIPYAFAWQPAAAGQRCLMALDADAGKSAPITMVTNWQAGLKTEPKK